MFDVFLKSIWEELARFVLLIAGAILAGVSLCLSIIVIVTALDHFKLW